MKSSTDNQTMRRKGDANMLFPIFVKLESLRVLIIGGGKVAEEKLSAIVTHSPKATIRLIADDISPAIRRLSKSYRIELVKKKFEERDLLWGDIVFSALNDVDTTRAVRTAAKKHRLLLNAADKPDLCDFYLGSIVQKGNLKVGISTNGKSPTIAKRLKAILETALPGELDEVLKNLSAIRKTLRGDLSEKVKQLNAITSILVSGSRASSKP